MAFGLIGTKSLPGPILPDSQSDQEEQTPAIFYNISVIFRHKMHWKISSKRRSFRTNVNVTSHASVCFIFTIDTRNACMITQLGWNISIGKSVCVEGCHMMKYGWFSSVNAFGFPLIFKLFGLTIFLVHGICKCNRFSYLSVIDLSKNQLHSQLTHAKFITLAAISLDMSEVLSIWMQTASLVQGKINGTVENNQSYVAHSIIEKKFAWIQTQ